MGSNELPDVKGGVVGYEYDEATFDVTDEMRAVYERDGVFLVRNLFSKAEVDRMVNSIKTNEELWKYHFGLADDEGRASKLIMWKHPGTDITGMVARVEKVALTCQKLLGNEEIYHYHTKLLLKEPRTGGKHLWHQDYGYWYKNGCLRPDIITAYIALDDCVKENGCLQVVKGTHRCGRIDHSVQHGQTVADQERVDQLCKHFEHIHAEIKSGDTLFFHSNLLHTSGRNDSELRRWTFLCSYNRRDNDPVYKHHHPNYTPFEMAPNDAVMKCENFTDFTGKEFNTPDMDKTVRGAMSEHAEDYQKV